MIFYLLLTTHITILAVTLYLHRFAAHRAFSMKEPLQIFFRFWLWLTTGMNTQTWVALHRKHHFYEDKEGDPHSPHVFGLKKVLTQGAELYREGEVDYTKFGSGCPDDWLENNIFKYSKVGVGILLIIDLFLFGAIGLTIWAIQMLWIPVLAAGVINGLGHFFGYSAKECKGLSKNIIPWGILVGGEELHSNHHVSPNSAKLSKEPWEFDLGYIYLKLFNKLKWVRL